MMIKQLACLSRTAIAKCKHLVLRMDYAVIKTNRERAGGGHVQKLQDFNWCVLRNQCNAVSPSISTSSKLYE
jgi:hypothetical protein